MANDQPIDPQRRKFCQGMCALGGLALSGATLPACGDEGMMMDGPVTCGAGAIGAGPASALAVGSAVFVPAGSFFVCRDAEGYYAVEAACTHIGTNVDFVSAQSGFKCPLHGATYSFDGKVTLGPATQPLPHLAICKTDSGSLLVDPERLAPASFRLKV